MRIRSSITNQTRFIVGDPPALAGDEVAVCVEPPRAVTPIVARAGDGPVRGQAAVATGDGRITDAIAYWVYDPAVHELLD